MNHIVKVHLPAVQGANAGLVAELAAIMTDLASLQVRVSRLFKYVSDDSVVLPPGAGLTNMSGKRDPQSPSNRDASTGDKACQAGVAEGNRLSSHEDGELQRHEGHSAEGAGEDDPSAMDRHSDPAPTTPTQKERVLAVYAATVLSPAEISRETGIKQSSVSAHLSMARKAEDERALKGDAARAALKAAAELNPEAPVAEDEDLAHAVVRTIPAAPAKPSPRPVSSKEAPPRFRLPSAAPAKPAPAPTVPVEPTVVPAAEPAPDFADDIVMVVHEESLRIYGPLGDLEVARPFALAMTRLQDGGLYDNKTLQAIGGWASEGAMKDHFRLMRPKLARIGVDLYEVNKFMTKVRRLEG